MGSPGQTIRYFLDANSVIQQALGGGNGVATTTGATLFDQYGQPIQPGNPLIVSDPATEAATQNAAVQAQTTAVGIGTPADVSWIGTGNATVIAALKAIDLQLAAGIPIASGSVKILGTDGVHTAGVNSSGLLTVIDTAAEASLSTIATQTAPGTQGTGGQYNPPIGGSGPLGYLSGIFAAINATITATLAAGTQTIGTVLLGAGSALVGKFQVADSAGTNLLGINASGQVTVINAAGTAVIGKVQPQTQAGAYKPVIVATTGTTLAAAGAALVFLDIQNTSASATLYIFASGTSGASFTATGSGTNLTTSAVTGTILIGHIVAGTGVPAGTTIVSQSSGPAGGAGVYVTSNATTSSGASLISGSIMRVLGPGATYTRESSFVPADQITGVASAGTVLTAVGAW